MTSVDTELGNGSVPCPVAVHGAPTALGRQMEKYGVCAGHPKATGLGGPRSCSAGGAGSFHGHGTSVGKLVSKPIKEIRQMFGKSPLIQSQAGKMKGVRTNGTQKSSKRVLRLRPTSAACSASSRPSTLVNDLRAGQLRLCARIPGLAAPGEQAQPDAPSSAGHARGSAPHIARSPQLALTPAAVGEGQPRGRALLPTPTHVPPEAALGRQGRWGVGQERWCGLTAPTRGPHPLAACTGLACWDKLGSQEFPEVPISLHPLLLPPASSGRSFVPQHPPWGAMAMPSTLTPVLGPTAPRIPCGKR